MWGNGESARKKSFMSIKYLGNLTSISLVNDCQVTLLPPLTTHYYKMIIICERSCLCLTLEDTGSCFYSCWRQFVLMFFISLFVSVHVETVGVDPSAFDQHHFAGSGSTRKARRTDLILLEKFFLQFLCRIRSICWVGYCYSHSMCKDNLCLVYSRLLQFLFGSESASKTRWSRTVLYIDKNWKNNFLAFRTKLWLWLVRIVPGWNIWMLAVAVL